MWQVCPVCNGTGQKSAAFYDLQATEPDKLVLCRACNGSGVLYSQDSYPYIPVTPVSPYPEPNQPYPWWQPYSWC